MSVRVAFVDQAEHCARLGSPFMARLMHLLAVRLDRTTAAGRHVLDWPGQASAHVDAVPLRLAGALHALVLTGQDADLAAAYPPNEVDDGPLWQAVTGAQGRHGDFIIDWMGSPPQTNEVRRMNALFPGFLVVASRFGLPLRLSEIGASAGLNLNADAFGYRFGEAACGDADSAVQMAPGWTGPPPPGARVAVLERAGCDLNPLDPFSGDDVLRLTAFTWPDQTDRLARLQAALAIARARGTSVERADCVGWLQRRLAQARPDAAHVIYHSIVWQYLPAAAQARTQALIESAGRAADENAPVAWLRMEGDGRTDSAAITLRLWPNGHERLIARADFHGRWVDWRGWG